MLEVTHFQGLPTTGLRELMKDVISSTSGQSSGALEVPKPFREPRAQLSGCAHQTEACVTPQAWPHWGHFSL